MNISHTRSAALRSELISLAEHAAEAGDAIASDAAAMLIDLLQLADTFAQDGDAGPRAGEILRFCGNADFSRMMSSGIPNHDELQNLQAAAIERWGDCLELLAPDERFRVSVPSFASDADDAGWNELIAVNTDELPDEEAAAGEIDVTSILASLGQLQNEVARPHVREREAPAEPREERPPSVAGAQRELHPPVSAAQQELRTQEARASGLPPAPDAAETIDDPELLAAFIDDAQQCLERMEATLLNLESGQQPVEAAREFCRELHTLKGASGTVGLSQLAAWLHSLEDRVEAMAASGQPLDVDVLLGGVDAVRDQLAALTGECSAESAPPAVIAQSVAPPVMSVQPVAAAAVPEPALPIAVEARESAPLQRVSGAAAQSNAPPEHFIRLEASRLDQLMDLLAELVMLRNRRDTYVTTLHDLEHELNRCADRLRILNASAEVADVQRPAQAERKLPTDASPLAPGDSDGAAISNLWLSRSLSELANDVMELGRGVQEVSEPLQQDNSAVKHLIGRFRQQLMDLRRLPVTGLFQKLQRTVRDAAKAEGRQVELIVAGQGTRVDRSLQERLFEPLMHIVRNAVSHGIESPADREAAGKPQTGTLFVEAKSDLSHLVIEVRDDGRGLNEERLELRGRELGLLPVGQAVSREQLWKLIFHPGFSTRSDVSKVSGRGVGMDVVDSWVKRLRGRMEIDSAAGQGTTFRLQIPLRSAIEHAMVVRVAGQLFALPMHAVEQTSALVSGLTRVRADVDVAEPCPIQLSDLLRMKAAPSAQQTVLSLRSISVAVDEVVGVEEVVVRALPPLLSGHELFSGVTLSGQGEIVLLPDVPRLIELARGAAAQNGPAESRATAATPHVSGEPPEKSILITDDSVTIRRMLARRLTAHGWSTIEAADGFEAMKRLRAGGISAVVTDIDMPRANGLELLAEMRGSDRFANIPVVVVTARDDAESVARIQELNPTGLLRKPVTEYTVDQIISFLSPLV